MDQGRNLSERNKNLLIECFTLSGIVTTGNSELNGRTTSNRGRITAVDLFNNDITDIGDLDLSVGGVRLIQNQDVQQYTSLDQNHRSVPLEINDGQTFQLERNGSGFDPSATETTVVFLRYGFGVERKFDTELSFHKITPNVVIETVGTTEIQSGTIPRNKGKCVGFQILTNDPFFGTVPITEKINFFVGGQLIVSEAPIGIFSPLSDRAYKKVFTDFDGGDVFTLERSLQQIPSPFKVTVAFFFDDDITR